MNVTRVITVIGGGLLKAERTRIRCASRNSMMGPTQIFGSIRKFKFF